MFRPGSSQHLPAITLAPLTALNLAHPTLAGAIAQAIATALGLRELLARRKP